MQTKSLLSWKDAMKYSMILEQYGENVPKNIFIEMNIDEGKFTEWLKKRHGKNKERFNKFKDYIKSKLK